MNPGVHTFLSVDFLPMLAGTLAAVSCALLGNFLLLRRLSLMGDAISHSVLPGLVVGFLITSQRTAVPMLIGAAIAGVVTVVLVEAISRIGRVEQSAAMGVTFSILFALGVLLMEQAASRHVDLDADCVLYGQLETLYWFPSGDWSELFSMATLKLVPRPVWTLLVMCVLCTGFVTLLFKELRLAAFDGDLATTLGFHSGVLHYGLMILVAGAAVAAFEAVGSILVIAMFIAPPAAARLLTDRLRTQILLSAVFAAGSGMGGYVLAAFVPTRIGLDASVNAAGMMTVVSGVFVGLAAVFSPSHGVLAARVRQRRLARQIALEDVLGTLFRSEEMGTSVQRLDLADTGRRDANLVRHAIDMGIDRGLILDSVSGDGALKLSVSGRQVASDLVRRHRLWESYLVDRAGIRSDHVHEVAERLEHLDSFVPARASDRDPHGKPIPESE